MKKVIAFSVMSALISVSVTLVVNAQSQAKFKDVLHLNAVPKSWELISVAPGQYPQRNNLYYKDKSGVVYIVQLDFDGGVVRASEFINKIQVDPKK